MVGLEYDPFLVGETAYFQVRTVKFPGWFLLAVWGAVVWILMTGIGILGGTPIRIPNHRAPNHQAKPLVECLDLTYPPENPNK